MTWFCTLVLYSSNIAGYIYIMNHIASLLHRIIFVGILQRVQLAIAMHIANLAIYIYIYICVCVYIYILNKNT